MGLKFEISLASVKAAEREGGRKGGKKKGRRE